MKRRTKIVCTLGPAVATNEKIGQLIDAGMNVARLNCSHGDWATRHQWIRTIRSRSTGVAPVGILADLQGPKFRIGTIPEGIIEVKAGQTITVGQGGGALIQIPGAEIFEAMSSGARLLLGDGEVEIKLGPQTGSVFESKVLTGGKIKSKQGVTLVGRSFDVPALTEKDVEDAIEAAKAGVDFIALSYVRQASDLRELRRLIDKYDPDIRICAKIETREALRNIDDIIKVTDVVMVARGDLGLQVDLEDVPIAQKLIIRKCSIAGKPVITATQMLESMVNAARPTRAESTDVANAILDGTDAVMLSGETAAGNYPIESVRTMARIVEKAEGLFDHNARMALCTHHTGVVPSTEAVAQAAVQLGHSLKARAIVTTSTTGTTPRMVSKFRPRCPIYCASWSERGRGQLSVVWGVESVYLPMVRGTDETVSTAVDAFMRAKRLKVGDTVVITAGVPSGIAGNTNLILVETVK